MFKYHYKTTQFKYDKLILKILKNFTIFIINSGKYY